MIDNPLQEIINTAGRVWQLCEGHGEVRPVNRSGIKPQLNMPSEEWILDEETTLLVGKSAATAIHQLFTKILAGERHATMSLYFSTLEKLTSLEDLGGMGDIDTESRMCQVFETRFSQLCLQLKSAVHSTIHRLNHRTEMAKKTSSFNSSTLHVLEAAYTRTKVLTTAETAIIAEAAGITPHQVRTWFQNKRNRGSKRNNNSNNNASIPSRPIQGLPKRAQPSSSLPSFNPSGNRRQVRGLPRRAQVSHNAPTTSIIDSSLGNFPLYDGFNGERMNRSPSLTSTISNSTELPNGGFISPFDNTDQNNSIPQISVEWGKGVLNVPVDVLEGGKLPLFNFTPPSPLNLNFNSTFNPNQNQNQTGGGNMMGGQIYDTPIEEHQYNPFINIPNQSNLNLDQTFDFSKGLESIESILSSALSDPTSFEQFSTLAASPQISLDSLSPKSDTLDSIPSLTSTSTGSSPGWFSQNGTSGEEGLDGGFFEALEGLLASSANSNGNGTGVGDLGSPFDMSMFGPSRSVSMSSQDSFNGGNGIISANEGIDLSYIAGIPLPPSPTSSSFALPTFENTSPQITSFENPSLQQTTPFETPSSQTPFASSTYFQTLETTEYPYSGTCTPSSTTSAYPLITPTTNNAPMVEVDRNQWNWIDGALPFDMVGMEVEMMEYGDGKMMDEGGWMMGNSGGMLVV